MTREKTLLLITMIPVAIVIVLFIAAACVSAYREWRWRTRDDHRLEQRRTADAAALADYDSKAARR